MTSVQLVLNWGGKWKSHHGQYWYEGRRAKPFDFPRDANYDLLLDKVYYVTGIDRDHYRVSMTTVAHTFSPSMPIEIVDDEDVALLLRRENVDLLVCISIEEIGNECPERNHKPPESSANPHHETREYEFHHTQKSNIQVTDIDEFQTSDVPNMGANLDDIVEGFTPTANIDTTSPHLIPDHDETEPQFNPIPNQFPGRYDEQFAHVQRLVPPPCAFYSIHSGEVATRPVTMRIEVGEVFPSKQQLQSQLGCYCLANQCQIRVFKLDTTRYQVRCIVEGCNWRMRAAKVQNSDHFQIRKFDNQHICSTEARFSHQRQASARVIGEHIQEKLHDHRLYKPKEIINDMQREFGISCNYHKGYRARHITLEEVQGTLVESYNILPSYLYMLEQTNPGTITDFHIDSSDRLHKAVGEVDDLVIVSDRKNSIITGVEKVFPNSFHGACAIHLQRNMLGHYGKNKALKREFDVDQLPCAHALACIRLRGFSFPDYCSPYYSSMFLVTAYSREIHPAGQPSEWLVPSDIASKIVHPPVGRRPPPGRPRKNRNPSFGEEVTQRRCTTCHRVGHNSHTCTYPKSSTMGSTCEIGEASGSHNVL
ncbi:hypothetical protein EZV62_004263 [Acer yangbiense]|uniref:Transposase MuDR plant domain-containing protein n=1 Tax=Acer yangbiense TaxID=1000413 RepID=A0A5C7IJI9_9ROSI|nr:hypothetical protein EZV62_004263 [Acer yangbiense]